MEFYSHGKLLVSGEYVVLDGAVAFALPTAMGQSLHVTAIEEPILYWTSYDVDGQVWMQEQVAIEEVVNGTDRQESSYLQTLIDVLRAAHRQNPNVLTQQGGFRVESKLTFPRLWGLGTSSTWINNVAQWFGINPYQLLQESFGGSGYDIACAQFKSALLYQRMSPIQPKVDLVEFQPTFAQHIYFVYLNQKQSSKEAIAAYRTKKGEIAEQIQLITAISQLLVTANTRVEFQALMTEHESILSTILGIPPIQQQLFADFDGAIKSLGAWGGDFVMAVAENDPTSYFQEKGYATVLPYAEMIAI
ncbi:GYDIA family GHMP kinase [Myroides odoratus]|uniref:GHMP kinase n=1 Tax=Myroides odoratus TaxID=256 RepID=A0A9Q7E923_MYROD|nr:GYDIA family GHMP kinase [Myroides odoratus]EHQ42953.1 hypothetical protein Myrod_2126 [Myroides odoratus DSM 2801]EKB07534.1 hypothetical protein HMPREF9716_01984 [Myroides odoratus CIP 103059]QQU00303.1 GHMP kinase [Myroides odoratus]WQD57469.1 GYDIA family GHMP kinase [Myroides odoratus]STZ30221.1 Uncharacterised protein [Myroides odoratus]